MDYIDAQKYIDALTDLRHEQLILDNKKREIVRIEKKLKKSKTAYKQCKILHWYYPELRKDDDFIYLITQNRKLYEDIKTDYNNLSRSIQLHKSIVKDRQKLVSFYLVREN